MNLLKKSKYCLDSFLNSKFYTMKVDFVVEQARLEQKSKLYQNLNETLHGLATEAKQLLVLSICANMFVNCCFIVLWVHCMIGIHMEDRTTLYSIPFN